MKRWLGAGGRKYDDVTQVSKPAVSPTSQSADRPLLGRLRIWKSARQQVWKPALQNTSPNLRPGALSFRALLRNRREGSWLAVRNGSVGRIARSRSPGSPNGVEVWIWIINRERIRRRNRIGRNGCRRCGRRAPCRNTRASACGIHVVWREGQRIGNARNCRSRLNEAGGHRKGSGNAGAGCRGGCLWDFEDEIG